MKDNQCPRCKSVKSVSNPEIKDSPAISHQPLSLAADLPCAVAAAGGGIFIYKGSRSNEMRAWICGSCGFTEFYAPQYKGMSLS